MSVGTLLTDTDELVHVEVNGYSADWSPATGVVDIYSIEGSTHTWIAQGGWDGCEISARGVGDDVRRALSVALSASIN